MAEKKYDLLLGPKRDSNLKIRNQPWYRERLISKYDRKPTLDASSWTFIKDGLDDFRDGKPPTVDASIVIKGTKGVLPGVKDSDSFDRQKPNQRIKKILNKHEAIYSKTIPNQEKRRKKIEDIENSLLSHPLALYPYIGQSLTPEIFQSIVELLDPFLTLSISNTPTASEYDNSKTNLPLHTNSSCKSPDSVTQEPIAGYWRIMRNVFTSITTDSNKLEEDSSKEEKQGRLGRRKTLPAHINSTQLSKIDYVTKEFCDWVRSLSGELNNIEEDTIKSLFASSCETNPILSAPIHVVELTNIPPDLRSKNSTSPIDEDDDIQEQTYMPSWIKMKYGAWYLDPKIWKARPASELLRDPKELEGKKMSQTRQKSKELDIVLSSSHGAQSFRQFVDKKSVRTPVFLESIAPNDDDNVNGNSSLLQMNMS